MNILIKNQYWIFATRISWADFNYIERKFKNSSEPYLDQLFLIKKDASNHHQQVLVTITCVWQGPHQVHMHLREPHQRHQERLDGTGGQL
jgi:hypothetical protein